MSIKRTIIAAVVGLTLVAMVAPAVTQGVTVEELLAQIQALTAQLNALQGSTTTSTATGACVGITFSRALAVGSTGTDVSCLQQMLNVTPQSGYFGPLTLAAVRAYQTSKGFTPANQVGPLTRAALNASLTSTTTTTTTTTTTGVTTTGVEGSLTVTVNPSPASGTDVLTSQSGVAVAAIDAKATNSDIAISRVDLNFNLRPWLYISSLTVSDGTTSKSVAVTQSNTTEITVGSNYQVRIDGVGIVVPAGTTKKLTFTVTGIGSLPSGVTSQAVIATVDTNAVRGTDGKGLSQYGPTAALATRSFTVKSSDTGTLEVSASSDNPKDRNIIVSDTNTTENVVLMKFNLTAKSNDVVVRTIRIAATASDTLATVMPTVYLYDGSTALASTSTAASSAFGDLSLLIPKGTTKTLTVMGTLAKQAAATTYAEGSNASTTLTSTAVAFEDATTFASGSSTGSDITGGTVYMYLKAPTFALVSQSITNIAGTSGSTTQSASASVKFNVTASGGDVWVRLANATAASSGVVMRAQDSATGTVTSDFVSNGTLGTNAYRVSSGETKSFEVSANISNTTESGTGYYAGVEVLNVKWATTDTSDDTLYTTQTWGLDDLQTGKVYLNPAL